MNFKKIVIKNLTCYYFDDIMRVWDKDIDFCYISLHKKLYEKKNKKKNENILIHDISYKTFVN